LGLVVAGYLPCCLFSLAGCGVQFAPFMITAEWLRRRLAAGLFPRQQLAVAKPNGSIRGGRVGLLFGGLW